MAIAVTVVVCIEAVANADPDARTVVVNSAHDDFTFEILIAFPNIGMQLISGGSVGDFVAFSISRSFLKKARKVAK